MYPFLFYIQNLHNDVRMRLTITSKNLYHPGLFRQRDKLWIKYGSMASEQIKFITHMF